jgi:hypothetical protein
MCFLGVSSTRRGHRFINDIINHYDRLLYVQLKLTVITADGPVHCARIYAQSDQSRLIINHH